MGNKGKEMRHTGPSLRSRARDEDKASERSELDVHDELGRSERGGAMLLLRVVWRMRGTRMRR